MTWLSFIPLYFYWHYTYALKEFFLLWSNLLWFVHHLFSIPTMLKTLFAPWRRLGEEYPKGLDLAKFFNTLIINTIMRIVGVIIRLLIILFGIAAWVFVFILGIVFFLVWLLWPFLILAILFTGIYYIF